MSSFFRSASDISESEDASTSQHSLSSERPSSRTNELVTRSQTGIGPSQHHQNVLVHALLEEKCLNDVCNELNAACPTASPRNYTKDDPEVRAQAIERYRLLSAKLVSHGLINGGPEHDSFQNVRQTARDGLSLLSQQLNVMELSNEDSNASFVPRLPPPTRKLLEAPADMLTPWSNGWTNAPTPTPHNLHLAQLLPSHPLLDSTRYSRDFEEICMLGKGGYGSVYHASHRLDGRSYAVKKIKLGPEVLSRVQQNGESELNAILRELRTMARLEHPNIVRYFGGWVEWTRESEPVQSSTGSQPRLITQGSSTSGSVSSISPPSNSAADAIFFADSDHVSGSLDDRNNGMTNDDRSPSSSLRTLPSPAVDALPGSILVNDSRLPPRHNRVISASSPSASSPTSSSPIQTIPRSPLISSDAAIEEITRPPPASPSPIPGPSLTLHIQMSLYPLTLAAYLSPASPALARHCFHRPAALRIFSSLLAGVAHLHAHGMAHRDIKPANIFLAPSSSASHSPSMDSGSCPVCATPGYWAVCVGDLGLVADRGARGGVGTALYRPVHPTGAEEQDAFALAVVLVELLVRFGTRMERGEVLGALRGGRLPAGLGAEESKIIRGLMGLDGERTAAVEECRAWVEGVLASV